MLTYEFFLLHLSFICARFKKVQYIFCYILCRNLLVRWFFYLSSKWCLFLYLMADPKKKEEKHVRKRIVNGCNAPYTNHTIS
jgi:hypothetical protein